MKKLVAIIAFIVSIIVAFINISQIPTGDELGGLAEAILALFYTAIIFIISIAISASVSSFKNFNQTALQISIYILCVTSVYYATWKVCIYRSQSMSIGELRNRQQNDLDNLISKGNKILANSENKNHTYIKKDSAAIVNYFIHFLDSSGIQLSWKQDSLYHSTFSHFFNRILTSYDSIQESINYRHIISKSLTLDYISFSPDNNSIFVILTYDVDINPTEANALALIGTRENGKLILYKYPCFRNDWGVLNKKFAFYDLVCDLINDDKPCYKENPFKIDFWSKGYFEKVNVNGKYKRNPPIIRTGCKYTKSNLFSLCLSRNGKELCWRATLEGY